MVSLKDFFSFKNNRFFWGNLIAMVVVLLVACYGTLFWLDTYTHHGESYIVPDVKNRTVAEADQLLATQLINGAVVDSTYIKGARPGIVLEQTPVAGARVKEGRTVYLTITTNSVPLIALPDLIDNSSLRQAAAKLKSIGFNLTEPELLPGEQDWVYGIKYKGQDLMSGDKIPHEAMLTLCVGSTHLRDSLAMDSTMINLTTPDSLNAEPQVDQSWF